ncbi:MAG: hydroxymethylglutaryl-CoA reductase, degradative [Bacteroidales bacterium]|nr:hydroxymethylglutaryl-CoA reductase, degradative [Bacteroidales bacterium]
MNIISGFSKLSETGKMEILKRDISFTQEQLDFLSKPKEKYDDYTEIVKKLSENYISNFSLPFGIAPNFLINNKLFYVPMVTEESSVVAAAAYAAGFWSDKGGFRTKIVSTTKSGQIYFSWKGEIADLQKHFPELKEKLIKAVKPVIANMEKRGGGITNLILNENTKQLNDYYIIDVSFETADSMGANIINSCLEIMAAELLDFINTKFTAPYNNTEIIMSILSNYTPECLVECTIECAISDLAKVSGELSAEQFAMKFQKAVQIANENVSRAVTHNKGIFNGIDAVLLATGNDFRAVEACGHAYAAREGNYKALTSIKTDNGIFKYTLRLPLSVGTVGGATKVHPMANLALTILQNPGANELMQIIAAAGLASNFAAIRALITSGIQKGHMKLHLGNMLIGLNATENEKKLVEAYFEDKNVSYNGLSEYLNQLREVNTDKSIKGNHKY